MRMLNKLFLALAFLGGSAAAQAADGNADISRINYGKNSEKTERSERTTGIRRSLSTATNVGNWSHSLSQQHVDHPYCVTFEHLSCTHNGVKLSQENLLGSYEVSMTPTSTARLFNASGPRRSQALAMSSSLTDGQDSWLPVHHLL